MTRGLPYSLVVHAVVLVLVVVYGNHVVRPPLQQVRIIPFRLVHPGELPVARENTAQAEAPKPEIMPPVAEPVAESPVRPPKEVPVKPREQEEPPAEETPVETPPAVAEKPESEAESKQVDFVTGPRVDATDANFPFAWYLARIEGLVDRNWNPRQLGFGQRARISCTVHFEIARNGLISGVSLTSGSGIGVYDREALRAVQTTRLPPLPPQYGGSRLGVTFIFNLEPDS